MTRIECGHETTRKLYGNIQTLVNNWLVGNGQSIGVGDTIADNVTVDKIDRILGEANAKVFSNSIWLQ